MTDDAGVLPPGPDGPVVAAALTRSVQALREFPARPGCAFSTAETVANLRAIHAHIATAQATASTTPDLARDGPGVTDTAALQAGLARLPLAGPIGSYSGATLAREVLARLTCDSPIRRILVNSQGAALHHGRAKRFAIDPRNAL